MGVKIQQMGVIMAREAIKFSAKGLENLKAENKTYKVRDTQAVSFFCLCYENWQKF